MKREVIAYNTDLGRNCTYTLEAYEHLKQLPNRTETGKMLVFQQYTITAPDGKVETFEALPNESELFALMESYRARQRAINNKGCGSCGK